MQGGAVPAARCAPRDARRVDHASGQPAAPAEPTHAGAWQSGVFAAVHDPQETPKPSGATVQFLPAVPAPDPNAVQPAAPVVDPSAVPAAQAPAAPAPSGDPAAQPLPPLPVDPTNPYPGDGAGKQALAQWLAREAQKAGLPPELPVMALARRDAASRTSTSGTATPSASSRCAPASGTRCDYAGYPERPELQMKWFIDQALRREGEAHRRRQHRVPELPPPTQSGAEWIADIEPAPAEQYRGRYQIPKLADGPGVGSRRRPAAAPRRSSLMRWYGPTRLGETADSVRASGEAPGIEACRFARRPGWARVKRQGGCGTRGSRAVASCRRSWTAPRRPPRRPRTALAARPATACGAASGRVVGRRCASGRRSPGTARTG